MSQHSFTSRLASLFQQCPHLHAVTHACESQAAIALSLLSSREEREETFERGLSKGGDGEMKRGGQESEGGKVVTRL